MPEEQAFQKTQHGDPCEGACGEEIAEGDNWGCLHLFVPAWGVPGFYVEVHQHMHIRCAPSNEVKWKLLRNLGNARSEYN